METTIMVGLPFKKMFTEMLGGKVEITTLNRTELERAQLGHNVLSFGEFARKYTLFGKIPVPAETSHYLATRIGEPCPKLCYICLEGRNIFGGFICSKCNKLHLAMKESKASQTKICLNCAYPKL